MQASENNTPGNLKYHIVFKRMCSLCSCLLLSRDFQGSRVRPGTLHRCQHLFQSGGLEQDRHQQIIEARPMSCISSYALVRYTYMDLSKLTSRIYQNFTEHFRISTHSCGTSIICRCCQKRPRPMLRHRRKRNSLQLFENTPTGDLSIAGSTPT